MNIPGRGGFSLPVWATKVAPTLTERTLKFIFTVKAEFWLLWLILRIPALPAFDPIVEGLP